MKFFETNRTPREETKSNKDTSTRVWADLINVVNKQIFWYFSTVATPRDINFVVTQKKTKVILYKRAGNLRHVGVRRSIRVCAMQLCKKLYK